jgi:HAD superfamily hydrolase (TIGR01662 family)
LDLKGILFDLGDTLVTRSVKDIFLMREALKEINKLFMLEGYENRAKFLFSAYDDVYSEIDHIRESVYVEIPLNVWLNRLLIRVYGNKFSKKLFENAINAVIEARSSFIKPINGVPEVLNEVRKRYKIGLISNNSSKDVVFRVLSKLNMTHYFDIILTSDGFGVRKPYPGIFLYALKKLNIEFPELSVFVGDSIKHDIYGAKNVGMTTILFNKFQSSKKTHSADFIIKEIKDLPVILERINKKF